MGCESVRAAEGTFRDQKSENSIDKCGCNIAELPGVTSLVNSGLEVLIQLLKCRTVLFLVRISP